ncbi:hypothetical protein K9N68_16200 [Kovacikia minuta CCNUW1]|uniref:hypothetical protein n=1 Tax=Kovacikia minuta TaxID=2931930 RepID=UPI001CCA0353|nr:hypothetical protein [Kovacikia minuta]UBF29233.1 hypothetical protein K9N68_16200 [Kovacikia minuta CCNUW1]
MANAIHSTHSQLLAIHQESMMASLARRLEIARAANNLQLVEQLEREKQQILSNSISGKVSQSLITWFKSLQEKIAQVIAGEPKLEVCQFGEGSDRWWYTFDPRTGECISAESEAEIRVWIQENYKGK